MAKKLNQHGFTLIEVLIALTLFGVFISAYLVRQGYNISDSEMMRKETILKRLCENKILEYKLKIPQFEKLMSENKETKSFEDAFSDYEYTVELKKLNIPDLSKLANSGEDEDGEKKKDTSSMEKKIFNLFKKNMKNMLWQIRITVNKKGEDFNYSISSWIDNPKAKIDLSL